LIAAYEECELGIGLTLFMNHLPRSFESLNDVQGCRRDRRLLFAMSLVAFAVAFALRLAVTEQFVGLSAAPELDSGPDQMEYELLAYRLSQGDSYCLTEGKPTASRSPGTPLTLAPIYLIFGRSYLAAHVWFCFISACTCAALVLLGNILWDKRIGFISALWLAVYPPDMCFAMYLVSEVPFAFYIVVSVMLTIQSMRGGSKLLGAFAALFWTMAIVTRLQLIFVLPLAWAAVIFASSDRKKYIGLLLLQSVIVSALVGLWILRNERVLGKATLSTISGMGFWGAHNDRVFRDDKLCGLWIPPSELVDAEHPWTGNEIEKDALAWKYGLDWARTNVTHMPYLCAMKLFRLVSPVLDTENKIAQAAFMGAWLTAGPFVALGVVVSLGKDRVASTILLMPPIAIIVSSIVFYGSVRFRESTASINIVFAAIGLLFAYDQIKKFVVSDKRYWQPNVDR
jgi:hypothetical protein